MGGGAARRGRRRPARRAARRGRRPDRIQRPPAARSPRDRVEGDGLLPVQQRRRRGAPRDRRARARAGDDPRLGRPPRQRDERHLLRDRRRAVHLDPPVPPVSGHGSPVRGGRRSWARVHGQPARAAGVRRRCLHVVGARRRRAHRALLRAGAGAAVSRLRRTRRGPACGMSCQRRWVHGARGDDAFACAPRSSRFRSAPCSRVGTRSGHSRAVSRSRSRRCGVPATGPRRCAPRADVPVADVAKVARRRIAEWWPQL